MAATPTRAADFIQSIGICAHIDSTDSSYGSSDVAGQMSYLGINNMRVMAPGSNLQLYTSLGQKGIKFDVISNDFNLQQDMSLFDKIAPYVTSIEGVNELNSFAFNYNGLSGAAGADAFQADLYKAIHADPKLAGVKVLPFSLSVGSNINGWGDVSAYADYGNVHGYAGQGVPPYYMLNYAVNSITTTPGKPAMMTETGYYTQNDGNSGVTEDVQAKWMLDTLFENSHNGVVRTYLYQLEDGYATPSTDLENHYGLYKVDGTAKESATALHNLTTILADTGANAATFTPGTLNYTVSGLNPDYGFQHVLAKSNGSFDIALWSEPQFFDAGSYKTSDVPATTVTVKLGGTYNVDVFDPIKGTGAIAHYQGVTSVDMQLATDPLVVEVSPVGTVPQAAAAPVPAPAVTPVTRAAVTPVPAPAVIPVTAAAVTPVTAPAVTPAPVPVTAPAVTSAVTQASAPPVAQVTTPVDATPANATGAPLSVDPAPAPAPAVTVDTPSVTPAKPPAAGAKPVTAAAAVTPVVAQTADPAAPPLASVVAPAPAPVATPAPAAVAAPPAASPVTGGTLPASTPPSISVSFFNDGIGAAVEALRNPGAAAPAVATPPAVTAPTTTPASPPGGTLSSITVGVSIDAGPADGHFTLKVDGVQAGGIQAVGASHAAGQSQAITLNGPFTAAPHTITVTFFNDAAAAAGGTPGAAPGPRQLYVDSVTAGGVTKAVNMAVPQADRFSFTTPTVIGSASSAGLATLGKVEANATVVDGGQTGGHTVAGSSGRDLFIVHAGVSEGDIISNFQANPASGDILQLTGYGAGATLTQIDATTWTASSAGGAVHDTIHLSNSAALVPANVVFA